MDFLYIAIAVLVLFICVIVIITVRSNRRLRIRIQNSFGKQPIAEYDLQSIADYHELKALYELHENRIDAITWHDLGMDDVFRQINVCHTSIGEEYLYAKLHEPGFDDSKLLKREKLITYLKDNPTERLQLQFTLAKLGKLNYNGLAYLIFNPSLSTLRYPMAYHILPFVPFLLLFASIFSLPLGIISFMLASILNGVVYYVTKRKIVSELATMEYFSSLLWCCDKICKHSPKGIAWFTDEMNACFTVFRSLKGKTSRLMQQGMSEVDFLQEYFKIMTLYEIKNYNKAIGKITKHADSFQRLYEAIGELDMAICLLSYRESLPFHSNPSFHTANETSFTELYHPLLSDPICNTASISSDSIITGSNASGKSTFIKAVAINGILAQTIYTCTAREYRTRFALVITSMAVADNIIEGDSYFIAEIKSMKRIIDKVQKLPCICFIDEILKGTNTIERIAASASVLEYLHSQDCLCMVASHDIELTDILINQFDNYHFCEQLSEAGISFDYTLKLGKSQTRNAIKLLGFMGFDETIVSHAEHLAETFIDTKNWQEV